MRAMEYMFVLAGVVGVMVIGINEVIVPLIERFNDLMAAVMGLL